MTLVVRAESLVELARAQGRATAGTHRDRLLEDQALLESRSGTAWDRLARRTLLVETAQRGFDALDDESREVFAAYAAGVSEGLAETGGGPPWQPWTPLGVFAVHHVLFGAFGHHLWRRHVRRTLGPDALHWLAHEVPATSGSNAWAVGGGRTASGRPMIGADPHRVLSWPGVYQRVRLVADGVDVVGLTFPGVPGVQHFGHTGTVAWAVTNALADTQDAVEVRLRRREGIVEADRGDGWRTCVESGDVVRTPWGPVVVGDAPADATPVEAVVLRWTVHVLGDLGLGAVVPLMRARTVADVDRALDHWVEPVNDVLVADREGTVRQRLAGRVPRRGDGAWDGWLDLPGLDVPPDGLVVSANHRRERWAAISDEFAPPHRARRLEELLADRAGLTVDEAAAAHADTLLRPARDWQARLAALAVTGPAAQRRDLLLGWDGRMDADSVAAGAFADLRTTLVRRLAAHPALVDLHADPGLDPIWTPWVQPEPRIALALDRWVAGESPPGVDLDAEIRAALVASAEHPARPWGESHGVDVPGHGWVPLAGDDACVLSATSVPGVTDACWRGPVARLVWDLDDRSASRWTVPDDVATWAAGSVAGLEDR